MIYDGRDSMWSAMRSTVVPLYQPARLAGLIPVMQSYVDTLAANIAACLDQDCIPFCQLSLRMAIDIIGRTAFGIEFGLSKNAVGTAAAAASPQAAAAAAARVRATSGSSSESTNGPWSLSRWT